MFSTYRPALALTFFATLCCMAAAGTLYGFSLYGQQLKARLGLDQSQIAFVGAAGNYGMYLGGVFWGAMTDRYHMNPRYLFLCAAVLLMAGYSLVSFTYSATIPIIHYLFLAFYLFVAGFGSACLYHASMGTNIRNWPPHLHGFAVGIPVSLLGLSAFIFGQFASLFRTVSASGNGSLDVAAFLIFVGIATSSVSVFASFTLRNVQHLLPVPPALPEESVPATESDPLLIESAPAQPESDPDVYCLYEPDAYSLAAILVALGGSGLLLINNVSAVIAALSPADAPADDPDVERAQSWHVQALSVLSFVGRVAFGMASDWAAKHHGVSRSIWLVGASLIMLAGQVMAARVRTLDDLPSITIAVGISYGAFNTIIP
ncbi:Nodulin-like-domain-containing protein, partial [Blyttiomyces helicus]